MEEFSLDEARALRARPADWRSCVTLYRSIRYWYCAGYGR